MAVRKIRKRAERGGGFRARSDYFLGRAAKARTCFERQRLLDAAEFYRQLARIAPDYPPGFRPPRAYPRSQRNLARAAACRALVQCVDSRDDQKRLIDLAKSYERLAAEAS